jgi:hypothetical protein
MSFLSLLSLYLSPPNTTNPTPPSGPNCTDTKTFVNLAGFQGLQTLLVGCKEQLAKSNSSIPYSQIDYGFREHLNFRQKWDSWTIGQRAGVGIGMTLAVLVGLIGLLVCCVAVSDL